MKKLLLFITLPFLVFSCSSQPEKESLRNAKTLNLGFYETFSLAETKPVLKSIITWSEQNDSIIRKVHDIRFSKLSQMISFSDTGEGEVAFVNPGVFEEAKSILELKEIQHLLPKGMQFMFSEKHSNYGRPEPYKLYAVKIPEDGNAMVNGKHLESADVEENEERKQVFINIQMTDEGAQLWKKMTAKNIGKHIAITLDGMVLSYPLVMDAITGGKTQISGNFTKKEAEDLLMGIQAGH